MAVHSSQKKPVSMTSSAPEANVAPGTPATPVVVSAIITEPDTFQEEDEPVGEAFTSEPETLLSPLMNELRRVAEGGPMTTLRQQIEQYLPEEKASAQSYLKALVRLSQAASSAASLGQEAFLTRFNN